MSLQRISFAEACAFSRAGEGTFFGSNGLIQTAAAGVPRFDYDPVTLEPKGILIEGGRTNLLENSSDLTAGTWLPKSNISAAIGDPVSFAPALNWSVITENTNTSEHYLENPTAVGAANTWYSLTFYFRFKAGTTERELWFRPAGVTGAVGIIINSAGVVTNAGGLAATEYSVTPMGGGAFKVWVRNFITASGNLLFRFQLRNQALAANNYLGDGTSGVEVADCKCEIGHFPSSSITTTTMPISRAADILTVQPAQFAAAFRQDAGTILIDMTLNHTGIGPTGLGDFPFLLDMDSAAAPEDGYRMVASANYGPGYKIEVKVGGSLVAGPTFVKAIGGGSRTKLALAWGGANDFAACMDGGAVETDTSGAIPTPDRLSIGCQSGVNAQMFGHVRKVLFFPQRLTNAQLQEATA